MYANYGLLVLHDTIISRREAYEKSALCWIASTAANPPSAQEEGACDGDPDEDCIDIVNVGKGRDSPQEVDGDRNDRC